MEYRGFCSVQSSLKQGKTMISDSKVIEIIGDVLNLQNGIVSINTSSENTDEWDSLEHLSILVALDQYLEGKAGELTELASATSVKGILEVFAKNGLRSDD